MDVRRMRADDLGSVRRLAAQLGYENQPEDLRAWFERIDALADHEALVAEEDGAVVGWIHVFGIDVLYEEPYADVAAVMVDEACRQDGVGRALMLAAEAWARQNGYGHVRVRSRLSREGAHRFYVRLGYAKEKAQYTFTKRVS